MPRSLLFAVLALSLLSACIFLTPVPTPPGLTAALEPTATPSPVPSGPPTQEPTATSVVTLTRARYTLQAVLDYEGRRLAVDETISYPNLTGVPLDDLVLAVEPYRWAGCFSLDSLAGSGVVDHSMHGGRLEVRLDPPLAPGGTLDLSLRYRLSLPPADARQVFGYSEVRINLVDWYPFVVPYDNGWLLHEPGAAGEHLVFDAADFDVTLTLTDPDLPVTLAASAPLVDGRYRLDGARTFAISASTAYLKSSMLVGDVTVESYYFAGEHLAGERVLHEVAKALLTYSGYFGPYPYPSLAVVEADFFDGMEHDGLFFLSRNFYTSFDGTPLNYLVVIAVHETAHQWWYSAVGNDQALEPWLDEALCTYSERLFYEANYPGVTAWPAFRIAPYTPSGWVDATIYDHGSARPYINAVYLRGAQFLHALRGEVGDEVFFAFLEDYSSQMAGRRATSADFFRILRQHTDADLTDLVQEFFSYPY